jgi:hypothetical protein
MNSVFQNGVGVISLARGARPTLLGQFSAV